MGVPTRLGQTLASFDLACQLFAAPKRSNKPTEPGTAQAAKSENPVSRDLLWDVLGGIRGHRAHNSLDIEARAGSKSSSDHTMGRDQVPL